MWPSSLYSQRKRSVSEPRVWDLPYSHGGKEGGLILGRQRNGSIRFIGKAEGPVERSARTLKKQMWRIVISGVLAGVVFSLLSVLTFYAIGVRSGILFNPAHQSPAVHDVIPNMVMRQAPYVIFLGWTIVLIGYSFLFAHIGLLWPRGYWRRAWRLALMIWFFSLLFFEFQGPYNLLHEPIPLLLLELLFWMICAFGAAATIVIAHGNAMLQRAEYQSLA
jgi:hypothetical protein